MLSQRMIATAQPGGKVYRLTDMDRLYLEVRTSGYKSWRFTYRYGGARNTLTLGSYPDVSLEHARSLAIEVRHLLVRGIDPATKFRIWHQRDKASPGTSRHVSASSLFKAVVAEYYGKRTGFLSDAHIGRILTNFATHLYPLLGEMPIDEIQSLDLLRALQGIEARSPDMAHRLLNWSSQVFRYSIATQRISSNPAEALRGALKPIVKANFAAITEPAELTKLLRTIETAPRTSTGLALRLMPILFTRPGELRQARWSEFDVDAILEDRTSVWEIPAERMKMKKPHMVPLSRQATALLKEAHRLSGHHDRVFPGGTGEPISDAAMNVLLKKRGYPTGTVTVHGFRATARTLLDEVLGFRVDIIEHQLAHTVKDPNGRAYNRTHHLAYRIEMMQAWSDYLETLRAGDPFCASPPQ